MREVDVVCPLYRAEGYIRRLLDGIASQRGVRVGRMVFPVTQTEDDSAVFEAVARAGGITYAVPPERFSHSLTRERAITEHCAAEVVIMLSQDVRLDGEQAFSALAERVNGEVPYVYGRQFARRGIERFVRERNYRPRSHTVSREDVPKLRLSAYFASDAFAAYHRPTYLALGGYDGREMATNEDMYYAKKLLDHGYRKGYCAEAAVEHAHRRSLGELYACYRERGKWFREHPEFGGTAGAGCSLALHVLKGALLHFDVPALLRWLPDMAARWLGMREGRRG